jgi:hypothetical protein
LEDVVTGGNLTRRRQRGNIMGFNVSVYIHSPVKEEVPVAGNVHIV